MGTLGTILNSTLGNMTQGAQNLAAVKTTKATIEKIYMDTENKIRELEQGATKNTMTTNQKAQESIQF